MQNFSVCCWNIQGLSSSSFGIKSRDPDFLKSIEKVDIVILVETWCREDAVTHCPSGYSEIIIPSTKLSAVQRGRDSGGILIWYRGELAKHISKIKIGTTHCWLKLSSKIGISNRDIYLCALYSPPIDSPYHDEDLLTNLHEQVSLFQAQGNVLLCGDFNARSGLEPDTIDPQGNIHVFGPHPQCLSPTISKRNSLDCTVNKAGKELMHLCRASGLYTLNGRIRGDSLGRFTYCSGLGASVVDYAITDMDPSSFSAFTVRQQTPYSDHSQIMIFIKTINSIQISREEPSKLFNINKTYRWAPDSADKFINTLNSPKLANMITNFINKPFDTNKASTNQAVKEINHIFHTAADMVLSKNNNNKKKQPKGEKWFDNDCKNIRKELRNLSNLKHHQPQDMDLRKKYNDKLKHYKHTLRVKKLSHVGQTLQDLEESLNQNQFWEMWNNLSTKKPQDLPIQNGEIWKNHFEHLYSEIQQHSNSNFNLTKQKLQLLEHTIKDNQNPLDFPITQEELAQKLKTLKTKKSCGSDSIRSEMLKNSNAELQRAVLKLFNLVLRSGYFPDTWNTGLITPIHKSGDKLDPNNFRGICVSSNLGKLFNSILNNRLLDFLNEHNVLSKGQIGFLPNHRTTDHIFTLHTLINENVHQTKNGKIFACFIDFKKAFDSIWHEGLYYRLLQSGVGGKVYDLIKSMYSDNKCAVKIGDKHTEFFSQNRGVRQGCGLSPTLFNIYINELAVQLEQSAAPGLPLYDTEVKFLLYADDLVLLSPTAGGLQQHLDLLERYCQHWALAINPKKTKVMIFQKKPRCQETRYRLALGSIALEHTMQYTYLGLVITASGSFSMAVNDLKQKARRAIYAIRNKLHNIDIPVSIWCKIFESVILPIALYGSEVWGPLSHSSYTRWDKHPTETLHAEFCRMILKIQRKTPTNACRAELGRFPLLINVQKRSLNFWMHLNTSPTNTLHFKALKTQELNPAKSPLKQLVLSLTNPLTNTNSNQTQSSNAFTKFSINQAVKQSKSNYLEHWNAEIKTQNKLEVYRTLKTNYECEEYLSSVRDRKQRQILTKYRLSDHSLAIEKGRHKKSWLPKEQRICGHCTTDEVETEVHFLLKCPKYESERRAFFRELELWIPEFQDLEEADQLQVVLGGGPAARPAARYILLCHNLRDNLRDSG